MSRHVDLPPRPTVADSWRPSSPRSMAPRVSYTRSRENREDPRRDGEMYHFRGNGYSDNYQQQRPAPDYSHRYESAPGTFSGDSYRPQANGFTFRMAPPPSYDPAANEGRRYPPPSAGFSNFDREKSDSRHNRPDDFRHGSSNAQIGSYNRQGRRDGRPRRYQPKPKTSERDIFLSNRLPTPELMSGMEGDGNESKTKFHSLEDLSDSDEADMEESDDDQAESDNHDGPKIKAARTTAKQSADGNSVPRWSNPDPYFVLPPIDEQRKTKDVVKLIRKARIPGSASESLKLEAVSDDFISFNFVEEEEEEEEDEISDEVTLPGVPGAPTGPRSSGNHPPSRSYTSSLNRNGTMNKQELDTSSDPALGSRKRNIDDEIKGPPLPIKRPGKPPPAGGGILQEWKVTDGSTSSPWCDIDHAETESMGVWLHKEIVDFYTHFKHKDYEEAVRRDLVARLGRAIKHEWPGYEIHPFGSFVAGLYLPTADIDLVFVSTIFMDGGQPSRQNTSSSFLFKVARFLTREGFAADESVDVITHAKVPLVKFVDNRTGLRVDISFENDTGLVANGTFRKWREQYPAMPILVTLIKQFLAMRGLNEPVNGGVGGFALTCLVVSLLQLMPQVQSYNMTPEHHLGEILIEFFDLYGNKFDVANTAISLDPPRYLHKSATVGSAPYGRKSNAKFCILDPNQPTNDISGGSSNTRTVVTAFSFAHKMLRYRMTELNGMSIEDRRGKSILEAIIGGNYSSFDIQRDHLWKCYQAMTR